MGLDMMDELIRFLPEVGISLAVCLKKHLVECADDNTMTNSIYRLVDDIRLIHPVDELDNETNMALTCLVMQSCLVSRFTFRMAVDLAKTDTIDLNCPLVMDTMRESFREFVTEARFAEAGLVCSARNVADTLLGCLCSDSDPNLDVIRTLY